MQRWRGLEQVPGSPGTLGGFDAEGRCVALVEDRDDAARAVAVFRPA